MRELEELIETLRLLITTCECLLPNNPDPNLNLELNNDLELNNNPNPNFNPDNFSPSGGFENLLIPERRFQDTALFKEMTEGNLVEVIKSRKLAKPGITPGYFSKDIYTEKTFSTLYGFKKL